jgi:glycosyltransferase involved in cell wall biosynthesis
MAKKRILFLVNKLNRGGAEKQLFLIVNNLKNHYEFSIAALKGKGDFERPFERLDIPIYHYNIIEGSILLPINMLKLVKFLSFVRSEKPSIIHSWLFHPNLIACICKLHIRGVRLVTSKRNSNFWYKKQHFLVNRLVYKESNKVVVNAFFLKKEILVYNNIDGKIVVIPNGIDTSVGEGETEIDSSVSQLRREGKVIIGSIGRFAPQKRYEDIITAAEGVVKKNRKAHFFFLGGRCSIEKYKTRIRELELDSYVTIKDEVENVYPYLKGFDIFLISSSHEGMPNVIMEAMVMGKPIIATKVGGVTDLIEDGNNGILVPPFRPDKIAKAIETLLGDKKLQRRFATNNKKKIREFSINKMISNVADMYDEVLSK